MTERELKNHFIMAWLSPACPIGAFSYSQGLEAAVEDGLVTDISSLKVWLNASLSHGSIKNDSVFLAAAFNSKSLNELQNLTDLYFAFCISSPTRGLSSNPKISNLIAPCGTGYTVFILHFLS